MWPALVRSCAKALAVDALQDDAVAVGRVMAWANRVVPGPTVVGLLTQRAGTPVTASEQISQAAITVPLERRAGVLRVLARGAVETRPTPERVEALAVLGRWPER